MDVVSVGVAGHCIFGVDVNVRMEETVLGVVKCVHCPVGARSVVLRAS